jgi:hypothetical protein
MADRSRSDSQGSQKENSRPRVLEIAVPQRVVVESHSLATGKPNKRFMGSPPTRKNGGKKNRKTQRKSRKTRHKRR